MSLSASVSMKRRGRGGGSRHRASLEPPSPRRGGSVRAALTEVVVDELVEEDCAGRRLMPTVMDGLPSAGTEMVSWPISYDEMPAQSGEMYAEEWADATPNDMAPRRLL